MKWKNIKQKMNLPLLWKEILSYSMVYVLPLIILSAFIYQYAFSTYRKNVEAAYEEAVSNFAEQMDQNLLIMQKIATRVSIKGYTKLLEKDETGYNVIEMVSILNQMLAGANDILDVGVWSEKRDFLICSSGTYQPENFEMLLAPGLGADMQRRIFSSGEMNVIQIGRIGDNYKLLYVFPLQKSRTFAGSEQSLFFILDVGKLIGEQFFDAENLRNAVFWEGTYPETNIIFTLQEQEAAEEILRANIEGIKVQNIDAAGERLVGFYNCTENVQCRMLFLLDYNDLYSGWGSLRKTIALMVTGCITAGVLLIVILIRCNYLPLKKICDYCIELKDAGKGGDVKDTRLIYNTLEALHEKVQDARPVLKSQTAMDILFASGNNIGAIHKAALEKEVIRGECEYAVLVIESDMDTLEMEERLYEYNMEFGSKIYTAHVWDRLHKHFIVICSLLDNSEQELQRLENVLLSLDQGKELTIGRSDIHVSVEDISAGYLEALSALYFKFVKGRCCTILYKDIKEITTYHNAKLEKAVDKIISELSLRDAEAIGRGAEDLLKAVRKNPAPLYQIKKAVYEVINVYIKLCIENDVDYQQFINISYDFSRNTGLETLEDVTGVLGSIGSQIVERLILKERDAERRIADEIKEYIKENALNTEFSVETVADYFKMSYSYVCRLFKTYHHCTILNSINECRMEKARELLGKSDLPVQEIALLVGYYNVTSFIRMFKKNNGMTPLDYRKCKKEETNEQ